MNETEPTMEERFAADLLFGFPIEPTDVEWTAKELIALHRVTSNMMEHLESVYASIPDSEYLGQLMDKDARS